MREYVGCNNKKTGKSSLVKCQFHLIEKIERIFVTRLRTCRLMGCQLEA